MRQNGHIKIRTLWGICSVVVFCLVFFGQFRLPIGLHNSCSISPTVSVKNTLHNIMTEQKIQIVEYMLYIEAIGGLLSTQAFDAALASFAAFDLTWHHGRR